MITIKTKNEIELWQQSLIAIIKLRPLKDKTIWKEDNLIAEITNSKSNKRIIFNGLEIISNFNYDKLLNNGSNLAKRECVYWQKKLIKNKLINNIISQIRNAPTSKRLITLIWRNKFSDHSIVATPAVYFYWRVRGKKLYLTSHFRSNDVYNNLLIDIDIIRQIQVYVAQQTKLVTGKYLHVVDSCIIFKKDQAKALKLKLKINRDDA